MDTRDRESTQATAATQHAKIREARTPDDGKSVNIRAANAAPHPCPSKRAVASIPLAEPLRFCGDEAMIILLFGDWNSANPAPQSARRQTIENMSA